MAVSLAVNTVELREMFIPTQGPPLAADLVGVVQRDVLAAWNGL